MDIQLYLKLKSSLYPITTVDLKKKKKSLMPLNQGRFLIWLSCLLFCLWAGFFPFLNSMLYWMDLSDV